MALMCFQKKEKLPFSLSDHLAFLMIHKRLLEAETAAGIKKLQFLKKAYYSRMGCMQLCKCHTVNKVIKYNFYCSLLLPMFIYSSTLCQFSCITLRHFSQCAHWLL